VVVVAAVVVVVVTVVAVVVAAAAAVAVAVAVVVVVMVTLAACVCLWGARRESGGAVQAHHDHLREELGDVDAERHVSDDPLDHLALLLGVAVDRGVAQASL